MMDFGIGLYLRDVFLSNMSSLTGFIYDMRAMKTLQILLGLILVSFLQLLPAQGNSELEDFGKNFLKAISAQDQPALSLLWINEETARATMASTGLDTAAQRFEIEQFKEALPRMKAHFDRAYTALMESLKTEKPSKAKFLRIERKGESKNPLVEKVDLLLYFAIKRKAFVLDIDDCVKTIHGWRFTGKFHLVKAE